MFPSVVYAVFLSEKRNATEIMHAYLGTGLEVLADKGYYNFTYVLRHDGVSTRNDDAASIGFGRSAWEVQGLPYTNMEGREYAFEVFPTIHTLMTQQVGRLGGAPVRLEARP
ncbi:hypothetical protein AK812_SmicGene4389 [Symbiodinium microadriaticum]|uniref:Uncharacterized protein n=1 Tax=Symbiodinium microadriaticum TaxID=2951 RepID=A0A1Q9EWA9_SYMMI|nr:hypothetical protein AK812_SmicGene4389 [Symbiodinium microadriaticum]